MTGRKWEEGLLGGSEEYFMGQMAFSVGPVIFFFKLFVTLFRTLSKGENNPNDLMVQIIAVLF